MEHVLLLSFCIFKSSVAPCLITCYLNYCLHRHSISLTFFIKNINLKMDLWKAINLILKYANSKTSEAWSPFNKQSSSSYFLRAWVYSINSKILIFSKLLFLVINFRKRKNNFNTSPKNKYLQRSSQIYAHTVVNVEGFLSIITYYSYFTEQILPF